MRNILKYELFEKKRKTPKEINKKKKKEVSDKITKLIKELEKLQKDENLKGDKKTLKIRIKRKDITITKQEEKINRLKKERIEMKERLKNLKEE